MQHIIIYYMDEIRFNSCAVAENQVVHSVACHIKCSVCNIALDYIVTGLKIYVVAALQHGIIAVGQCLGF